MTINNSRLRMNEHFESSDLALATFLSMLYPLEAIDRRNPQKALFIFKKDKNIDKYVELFWTGKAQVSPQAYFHQLRMIKGRLYESR